MQFILSRMQCVRTSGFPQNYMDSADVSRGNEIANLNPIVIISILSVSVFVFAGGKCADDRSLQYQKSHGWHTLSNGHPSDIRGARQQQGDLGKWPIMTSSIR